MTDTEAPVLGNEWDLVADIGGTNARFSAVPAAARCPCDVQRYSVADYPALTDALDAFLLSVSAAQELAPAPRAACFAVACAVDEDVATFTNSPWVLDRALIGEHLGRQVPLRVCNDLEAVGYALGDLEPADWRQIGGGRADTSRPAVVIGTGTGLGVCTLVPLARGFTVLPGEGGHVDFAPVDEREMDLLRQLSARLGRVSVERLLCGPGIVNIYQALAQLEGISAAALGPEQVVAAALGGDDALAAETIAVFCRALGSLAGNLALTVGAHGGVYIVGGIVPGFLELFLQSDFRQRFQAKGRFATYLEEIPVRVVLRENLGLLGALNYARLNANG